MLSQNLNRTMIVRLILTMILGLVGIAAVISFFPIDWIPAGGAGSAKGAKGDGRTGVYAQNWDDNPVAYLPEAEAIKKSGYAHHWDENPAAYIPEAELLSHPGRYLHHWDDNPVAYIPEAELMR